MRDQSVPALNDINLTIRAGEMVALVGSSGSGKTTMVNLIPRFYEPTAGRILIDGVDIQSYTLRSLRSQIGMVSQDVVLFDDSIRNNIAFGRENATDEDIIQAARLAYAHDFVERLPQGYRDGRGRERGETLPAGNGSAWPSPARFYETRPCLFSTKRHRHWIPSPNESSSWLLPI